MFSVVATEIRRTIVDNVDVTVHVTQPVGGRWGEVGIGRREIRDRDEYQEAREVTVHVCGDFMHEYDLHGAWIRASPPRLPFDWFASKSAS